VAPGARRFRDTLAFRNVCGVCVRGAEIVARPGLDPGGLSGRAWGTHADRPCKERASRKKICPRALVHRIPSNISLNLQVRRIGYRFGAAIQG
jgi:hypothetical protein